MNRVKSYRPSRYTTVVIISLIVISLGWWIYKANQHPDQGMVYGKKYHEPYSWVQMVCSGYNKNGTCMVYVPITHNEPACYELILRAEGEEWGVCVDPTTYDTIPYESTFKAA